MWKRNTFEAFKSLQKLMAGVKFLDDALNNVFEYKRTTSMQWLEAQKQRRGYPAP